MDSNSMSGILTDLSLPSINTVYIIVRCYFKRERERERESLLTRQ